MTKKTQVILSILAVTISTLSYSIPTMMASSKGIDWLIEPKNVYLHYAWRTSGFSFIAAFYSVCTFLLIPPRWFILKLISCWLAIGETFTFVFHVVNKFFLVESYNGYKVAGVQVVFAIGLTFFSIKAYDKSTDKPLPTKRWLVNENENIKTRKSTRYILYFSSLLIMAIGVFYFAFGTGVEVLSATCISIPIMTIYVRRDRVQVNPVYIINIAHLTFWAALSVLLFSRFYVIVPIVMTTLHLIIFLERKYNFILLFDECNRVDYAPGTL